MKIIKCCFSFSHVLFNISSKPEKRALFSKCLPMVKSVYSRLFLSSWFDSRNELMFLVFNEVLG